jgi:hypothetical protein
MVNKDGSILHKKTIAGQQYRVIITKRGSTSVWSARDTIKNETNGNVKEMTRKEWYKLFKQYK